jgi:hypothetical protein
MVEKVKVVSVESEHEIPADDILNEFGIKGKFTKMSWDKKRNMLRLMVEKDYKYYTHEIPVEEIIKRLKLPKGEIVDVYRDFAITIPTLKHPEPVADYIVFTIIEKAESKLGKVV